MINALTIAGTDPSGGAGIHADLKTFSALGAYGMSVITAQVAQNTQGVQAVLPTPLDFLEKQFFSVIDDVRVDSVKVGALVNPEIVALVAKLLRDHPQPFVVLDTVMIAKGGHPLLVQEAVDTIRDEMLPLSSIITPNLPEAAALLETREAQNYEEMVEQGQALLKLGPKSVLMKGGHLTCDESPDVLVTADEVVRFDAKRVKTKNCHGTGCTLSAAIVALYPEHGLVEAVRLAKEYITGALEHADRLEVGKGIGPTHHFYRWW